MRINKLCLKNIALIYSGLGKYEIELLFTNDKMINIIIGKMGTCKSVILGMLQPFASFGTLDNRNQDSLVIKEMDGQKIIEYQDGLNKYIITHEYIWNNTTHNVKSYILKNGIELNPNGNSGSFKERIEMEFGIEQNFLRLLRLGPNVSNLINMKSTERKSFVASLLEDAEVYNLLYKKLNDDLRAINAQISLLSNKLLKLDINREEEIKENYAHNREKMKNKMEKFDEINTSIIEYKNNILNLLDNNSIDIFKKMCADKEHLIHQIKLTNDATRSFISNNRVDKTMEEINRLLGSLDQKHHDILNNISQLEIDYKEYTNELNVLMSNYKVSQNMKYKEDLINQYNSMIDDYTTLSEELKYFKFEGSSTQLSALISDLKMIDQTMQDIIHYDRDIIHKLYNSDESVIKWSKTQINILQGKRVNLQKEISNIEYSKTYQVSSILYVPPMCPSKKCPYYKTHPHTIMKKMDNDEHVALNKMTEITDQIAKIDADIYIYMDYPLIYNKINSLKDMMSRVRPLLKSINSLKVDSLIILLTEIQYEQWYDYNKIVTMLNMCTKRDNFYILTEKLEKIKNELHQIEIMKDSDIEKRIETLRSSIDKTKIDIDKYDIEKETILNEISSYNNMYLLLSDINQKEIDIRNNEIEIDNLTKDLTIMTENLYKAEMYNTSLTTLAITYNTLNIEISDINKVLEDTRLLLSEIKLTKKEYENLLFEKEYYSYIVDAVSSKEGIPLEMIRMFLNGSKSIMNELISHIFEDDIEILDFDINETDFKIPYTINGFPVNDIEKASQGQQSIISIALSFALIRESMFKYNIMLFDEVDAPVHDKDRQKFLSILLKQVAAINAEQFFIITHNVVSLFNNSPANIIMTTDETIEKNQNYTIMKIL